MTAGFSPGGHAPFSGVAQDTVLDDVDKRLVAALQVAPRASWQQIATALDVSESTVSRRSRRLLASGVVRVNGLPDPLRCGLGFPVLIQVGCAVGAAASVARSLAMRSDVRFVAMLAGSHDLVVEVIVASRGQLAEVLLDDLNRIPGIVRTTTEAVVRNFKTSYDWARELLGDRADLLPAPPVPTPGEPMSHKVDADDLRLIELLSTDGRLSAAELAKRSNLSESTARRRVDALSACGALHFATFVDPVLLGFEVPLFLWLDVDLSAMEEVAQALVARHEVRYLSATAGYSDLTAEVILPDLDRLYDFLTGVVGSLPGVRRSEVGLELTTVKRNYET